MSSIKKNFLYNVLYQFLILVLPLITAPYISRVLGVEGIGIYSYSYSVASIFLLFANLGILNHGNRSIAANRDDRSRLSSTFINIYTVQIIIGILVSLIYFVYIKIFFISNSNIAVIQSLLVLSALFDISWVFFGLEKHKLIVVRNTILKILTVLAVFIFVKDQTDLWKYVLIMALGVLVSQLIMWKFVKNYIDFIKPSIIEVRRHIKPIVVLFLPVLAYSIYRIMSKIMLGNMTTMTEVGYFENADKIVIIPMGIITALGTVMLPRISNLVANGKGDKQREYIDKSMKFVTIVASGLSFGLAGIADIFAPVYFGDNFAHSGVLIKYLAITILFASWASVIRTQYLIPNKMDKIYVLSMTVAAFVNIVLNFIFIPKFQSSGAIVGTITAEFLVMFLQFWSLRKTIIIKQYCKDNYWYILFGLIMFAFLKMLGWMLGVGILTLIIQICTGGLMYIGLTFAFMYIKKDEMLRSMIHWRKIVHK